MKRAARPVPAPSSATTTPLRGRAEVRLRGQRNGHQSQNEDSPPAMDAPRLLHELQVHQIELEMQNEELRKAGDEMEAGLEKYNELFDFAPVGYLTLDREGAIREANLAGASLLGIPRAPLMKQRFGFFVDPADRPAFNTFLLQIFNSEAWQECDLRLQVKGKPPLVVRIRANRFDLGDACRLAVTDITEHQQADDRVRVSEIRYRRLFEATHDGVLLLDPATRKITDANPFMTRLLDYPRGELIGKELFEIGLLKDEAASQEMFEKLKRKREVRYEDLPLESRGGRHQEVEVVANLYLENGHAVIQCNIRDITARKRAEQALRASEERYRSLFNSIDEGFCIIEMLFDQQGKPQDYRYLEINPSFEMQSGIHGGQGKRALEVIPHLEAYWLELYGRVALTGNPVRFSNEAKGLNRWFDVYACRLGGPESRNVAVLFSNITERKRAEEVNGHLVAIVQSSSDAIIGKTLAGVVTSWNTGAKRLFGYRAREIIGQPVTILIPPDLWPEESKMMARLRRGDSITNLETVRLAKSGRRCEVSISFSPIRDAAGAIIGASTIARDITERKRAEATDRRAEALAFANRAANKEIGRRREVEAALRKSDLVQRRLLIQSQDLHARVRHLAHQLISAQEEERKSISRELHDSVLQTLVGINVELGVLSQGAGGDSPDLQRKIARTQQVVAQSIDTVHRFARDLRPAVLDDFGLVPALRTFCGNLAGRAKLKVRLTASSDVETLNTTERTVLFRVAQEALTNVTRHAHATRVTIRIRRQAGAIRMEISDDGRSFPVKQLLQNKHPQRLGLVSMRERVEMVGGTLVITSVRGKGTTVRVEIPRR